MAEHIATGSAGTPTVFGRVYQAVPLALSAIASSALVGLMLLIVADIGLRFFFSRPINGVSDIVALTIVACVFLQLGSTIGGGRLVRADFLIGAWHEKRPHLARTMELVFYAAAAAILAAALLWLWHDLVKSYHSGEFTGAVGAYQITVWPFKLAVVTGCAVAFVEAARRALLSGFDLVRALRRPAPGEPALSRDLLPIVIFVGAIAVFLVLNFALTLSPVWVGIISLAGLLVAVTIGMPIAFALLALSFLGLWLVRHNPAIAQNALGIAAGGAIRSYEFGVVPLFVLMGLVLDRADVGRDAFQVAVHLLRRVRGGLGMATVAANAIFASITGSSIASAAVFSRIAVPPMIESGYTPRFAVGVVTGSSVLGMLIPPSLLLIIYGLLAEASVGKLFIAAIVPGLLLASAFAALNVVLATWFPAFVGTPKPVAEEGMPAAQMAQRLAPVIAIVAVVMGGIYAGVFTATEAGAVGALGAFIVGFARRKLGLKEIGRVVLETGYIAAGILFLIIAANLYGRMLTLSTIPMQMTAAFAALDLGFMGFLVVYLVILILLGMILDSVSIMLIILPIVLPVVAAFGGDPIWFGVVTVIGVEIGLLTPPFGLSVFVVKGTLPPGFASLRDIFTGAFPFVIVMATITLILMAFPAITLFLL
ncbi:TRAP transporter large permease subunit [Chelativorans salis]|uniref:TRAP transporter large permease subunit n=1 Tax=Chelativorans salis TaxID=2978478 RepID=A0ABT2LT13_9HYPH|nr:TRAP transporter large permease subunit [Chelativorans sp. EGI FJ00035]MCT7377687.1 TRAP transporter large permease subunit [Chelativorans sp. EGI FJ00035]